MQDTTNNPDIIGFILTGSRGKGFQNEHSDYDAIVITKDESIEAIRAKYNEQKKDGMDLTVRSLSEFKASASWESPDAWNRYDHAHMQLLVDKTDGEIEALIEEKGKIPDDKLNLFIEQSIDAYMNGVYRSVKCIRNHNPLGAHLEASNSILDLLTLIFALEGRHRPFLGYVQKELDKYPLKKLPWSASDFVEKIKKVLESADLETQQELLKGLEKISRDMGYGHIFDAWEGKDKWTMDFKA